MKFKYKIAVITINKDCSKDLLKTVRSVDNQVLKPNIHIIVTKKLEKGIKTKIKKNYRKFIIGKDTSIYNAMNIGLKKSWGYNTIFLNSGDIFFNNKSILKIKKNIEIYKKALIFKTILQFKNNCYAPKLSFFKNKNYFSHPSFIRPSVVLNSDKIYFNENKKISADTDWIKKNIRKFDSKKINMTMSKHFLGGISSNPTLLTLTIKLNESFNSFAKELLKFFLKNFLGQKKFYDVIYFFKYKKN